MKTTLAEYRDELYRFTERRVHPKTHLIYDHPFDSADEDHFPSIQIIRENGLPLTAEGRPNYSGYGTGQEDCNLTGGTLLDAIVCRYEADGLDNYRDLARLTADGMIRNALAGKNGFLPRGLSPHDGETHFIESSIDQYTMFFYGLTRYAMSGLCSEEEKAAVRIAFTRISERAERNICEATGYDMLREDDGPTIVTRLWGSGRGNHETMRLPMFYLCTWVMTEKDHWLQQYRMYCAEGLRRSLPMTQYWHLYTMQQMAASVDITRRYDPDAVNRTEAEHILDEISEFVEMRIDALMEEMKLLSPEAWQKRDKADPFYRIQDAAIIPMVQAMAPHYPVSEKGIRLCEDTLARMNLQTHQTSLPIHFLSAAEHLALRSFGKLSGK